MAQAKFINNNDFEIELSNIASSSPEIFEKALRAGADIIADKAKANLQGVLSPFATGELVGAFGITPVALNKKGSYTLHIGFGGYQKPAQKGFPNGVPFQLIARSIESGAVVGTKRKAKKSGSPMKYWRKKTPFAAPAVRATKDRAIQAIRDTIDREFEKITKNGG